MAKEFAPLQLDHTMPFGKFKGCIIRQLIEKKSDYVVWLLANSDLKLSETAMAALANKIDDGASATQAIVLNDAYSAPDASWGCF